MGDPQGGLGIHVLRLFINISSGHEEAVPFCRSPKTVTSHHGDRFGPVFFKQALMWADLILGHLIFFLFGFRQHTKGSQLGTS